MDLGGPGRGLDLGVGGVRLGVAQVLADRRVQEVGLLADDADDPGEVDEPQVAQVDAVDGDAARGRVVEAGDERGERALAGAGLADESERRPRRDVEVTSSTAGESLPG